MVLLIPGQFPNVSRKFMWASFDMFLKTESEIIVIQISALNDQNL